MVVIVIATVIVIVAVIRGCEIFSFPETVPIMLVT